MNLVLSRAIAELSTPWIAWTYEPSGECPWRPAGPMIYADIVAGGVHQDQRSLGRRGIQRETVLV